MVCVACQRTEWQIYTRGRLTVPEESDLGGQRQIYSRYGALIYPCGIRNIFAVMMAPTGARVVIAG